MQEGKPIVSGVGGRYASALFDLAREAGAIDETKSGLDRITALLGESPDFLRLVRSPVFSTDEQQRAMAAILEKAGIAGLAVNFVKVVIANRRLFVLPDMIAAFGALVAKERGEMAAEVTSAEPLSDEQAESLAEALKAALKAPSGQTIALHRKVDPSLIGGLIVKVGSRMFDTSLKTKLNTLKIAMREVR